MRASNTQPVIVVRAEARDEDTLNNYRNLIEAELREASSL